MTDHPHEAQGGLMIPPLACFGCIEKRKIAEAQGAPEEELPPLQVAITLVGGTAFCWDDIVFQPQSPLLAANGQLPPGLRRPGG